MAAPAIDTSVADVAREFHYQRLPQNCIRLLSFASESSPANIALHIDQNVAYLAWRPKYVALSYCWGDPTITKTITLNGCPFEVTENLWDALGAIREHHDRARLYWVDAICINQSDIDERSQQVQQMWQTYSMAEEVFAWLGREEHQRRSYLTVHDEPEKIQRAFDIIYSAAEACPSLNHEGVCDQQCDFYRGRGALFSWQSKQCFKHLLDRPYFERTWIRTEFAQARKLSFLCGRHLCPWQHLAHCRANLPGPFHRLLEVRAIKAVDPMNALGTASMDDMLSVLYAYVGSACSDERDRLFAMLGHPLIRQLNQDLELKADYSLRVSELVFVVLVWVDYRIGGLTDSAIDSFFMAHDRQNPIFADCFDYPFETILQHFGLNKRLRTSFWRSARPLLPSGQLNDLRLTGKMSYQLHSRKRNFTKSLTIWLARRQIHWDDAHAAYICTLGFGREVICNGRYVAPIVSQILLAREASGDEKVQRVLVLLMP